MIILAVFICIGGTASSDEHKEEAIIVGLVQFDVPINEKDIQVVDGFLPVHGVIKQDIEIVPATPIPDVKTVLMVEANEAGEIINIIYESD